MPDPADSPNIVFGTFDPKAEVIHTFRNLPHWFQPEIATFLTFRTGDSMPRNVVLRWRQHQEQWLIQHGLEGAFAHDPKLLATLPRSLQSQFRRRRDMLWHDSLDQCHGACLLRRPIFAQMVADALLHFDGARYDLDSFIVMPNHVHLLVQFHPGTTMSEQTESWLRYSARRINKELGRTGSFWQSEPFDHLIRSAEQFEYLQRYIAENPKRANLKAGEYLYWHRGSRNPES